MRPKFKLKIRLLLLLWGLFFLVLFIPSTYYNRYLKQEILNEGRIRANRELSLVKELIKDQEFPGAEQLHHWLEKVARQLKLRITFVAEGGQVIADSDVPYSQIASLDNHANRPEVAEALSSITGTSTRYSGTLQADLLYVAARIEPQGPIPGGVLRVAVPLSGIFYGMARVENVQYITILIGLLVFMGISLGLIVSTSWSISTLSRAAGRIGQGNVRVPPQFRPGHDFYPLAKAITETDERMASYIDTITSQKMKLESILEGIEEGIFLLNSNGKIVSVNKAAREMFPQISQLVGRLPLEVVRSPDFQSACNRVLAGEIFSYHSEVSTGTDRYYHVNVVRTEHPTPEFSAILALHDISELKHLERIRRDFVANASHELRTPLTSIKGYAELLAGDDNDPDMQRSSIETILRNTNHMIKLVNDLLQLARAEDYSHSADIRPVSPAEALTEAWRACSPAADSKNIMLRNDITGTDMLVMADLEQLTQVFRNLLENAVKYAPPDSLIEVGARAQDRNIFFSISDEGPGIPRQDQQKIFERFFRVQKHRLKESGSTGLGLAICRNILRNHGGSIYVESPRAGRQSGAAFHFTLPQAGPLGSEQ